MLEISFKIFLNILPIAVISAVAAVITENETIEIIAKVFILLYTVASLVLITVYVWWYL